MAGNQEDLDLAVAFAAPGFGKGPTAVENWMAKNPTVFGKPPSVDITNRSLLTPGQSQALQQLLQEGTTPGSTNIGNVPQFRGDLNIDPSMLEGISLQGLEDRANTLATGSAETLNASKQALLQQLQSGPEDFEKFFEETIKKPLVKQFNEEIFPSLTASFSKNFFSGGAQAAGARREEDLTESLTSEFARLGFESRESDLERKLRASELVNEGAGSPTNELTQLFQSGQQATGLSERNIDRQFKDYLAQLEQRNQQVSQLTSAIGIPALENIVLNDPGSEGLLGGFLGGFGQGLGGGAGAFFSHSSLKTEEGVIDPIATLDRLDALKIRKWKYKGDQISHVGPFAEEFAKTFEVGNGVEISVVDVLGVLLASVQGLRQEIKELREAK